MNNLNKTYLTILKLLGVHFIVFLILGYFFRDFKVFNTVFGLASYKAYVMGLVLGILFSVGKITLLKKTLLLSLSMSKNKSTLYTNAHYYLRFILTGIMLYVAITNSNIDFLGSLIGLISLQTSSYIAGFLIADDASLKLSEPNGQN